MALHDWKAPILQLRLGIPLRVLDGGSHRPIVCQLESNDGEQGQWVVKTRSMYHGTTHLLRELIGADLYSLVGLAPPRVGLLRLPSEALPRGGEAEIERESATHFSRDAGLLAFCSEYVPAPPVQRSVFIHRGRLNPNTLTDAIKLYVIDRFLWHGDRTIRNSNCLVQRGRLLPIDHDRIFAGLSTVDDSGFGPDLSSDPLAGDAERHVAFELVRKHPSHPAWLEVAERIKTILAHLPELRQRWPMEWDRSHDGGQMAGVVEDVDRFLRHRVPCVVGIMEALRS